MLHSVRQRHLMEMQTLRPKTTKWMVNWLWNNKVRHIKELLCFKCHVKIIVLQVSFGHVCLFLAVQVFDDQFRIFCDWLFSVVSSQNDVWVQGFVKKKLWWGCYVERTSTFGADLKVQPSNITFSTTNNQIGKQIYT